MTDDLLERATRLLREDIDGASSDAQSTEERVVALAAPARRLRPNGAWNLSLAALLIGSSVWAARGPVAEWFSSSEPTTAASLGEPARLERAPLAAPASGDGEDDGSPAESDAPPAPQDLVTRPAPDPEDGAPRDSAKTLARQHRGEEPAAALEPPSALESPPALAPALAPAPPDVPLSASTPLSALDIYRAAHELHFVRRDYSGALDAWDAYLRAAPSGALALEARFHRAVCLMRLGQRRAAELALAPFLRGDYGTYRRAEAERLLASPGEP